MKWVFFKKTVVVDLIFARQLESFVNFFMERDFLTIYRKLSFGFLILICMAEDSSYICNGFFSPYKCVCKVSAETLSVFSE